jgi:biotin carboxyl carrier protein
MVKVGDTVKAEQLITVESTRPPWKSVQPRWCGQKIKVKLGDKVKQGSTFRSRL